MRPRRRCAFVSAFSSGGEKQVAEGGSGKEEKWASRGAAQREQREAKCALLVYASVVNMIYRSCFIARKQREEKLKKEKKKRERERQVESDRDR